MAVEAKRGCGYRKIGGVYLEGGTGGLACGKLPLRLVPCALCDHVQPFSRGLAKIRPRAILHAKAECQLASPPDRLLITDGSLQLARSCETCPLQRAVDSEQAGLLWVGDRYYSPAAFTKEAAELGVSRRLPHFPTWLEIGKTWVFVAHLKTFSDPCDFCRGAKTVPVPPENVATEPCPDCEGEGVIYTPGVFYAFQPTAVSKIIPDTMPQEERDKLVKRGYKLVEVPHDDPDHAPSKSKRAADQEME